MDPRFAVSRDEFHTVQMDVKQMQIVQSNHAERLARLEKRHADDAAIKSVWNSPFPSALGGTPQHGQLASILVLSPASTDGPCTHRPASNAPKRNAR
jgi:hypothetical protein